MVILWTPIKTLIGLKPILFIRNKNIQEKINYNTCNYNDKQNSKSNASSIIPSFFQPLANYKWDKRYTLVHGSLFKIMKENIHSHEQQLEQIIMKIQVHSINHQGKKGTFHKSRHQLAMLHLLFRLKAHLCFYSKRQWHCSCYNQYDKGQILPSFP